MIKNETLLDLQKQAKENEKTLKSMEEHFDRVPTFKEKLLYWLTAWLPMHKGLGYKYDLKMLELSYSIIQCNQQIMQCIITLNNMQYQLIQKECDAKIDKGDEMYQ